MSDRPVGPDSAYRRGVNYAEIYLEDDSRHSPEEVEALRRALAAQNAQDLRIPNILDCFAASGHPDHPAVVDPEDEFWQGFLDRVDRRPQG
ncbi:hypothetical protein NI17_011730 [Thermobifida halotolerans]|uniref:Uncharacterized protein n=1 Tax=Thermobifida halotolerans TaxID=483545 RepID=A0A399G3W5_9ACTN|nr:hypothetical protein [Thermobifida halotolerans]UOE21702.1 hypothetical protein NI17_011730 [Thermobifida halotolerans]